MSPAGPIGQFEIGISAIGDFGTLTADVLVAVAKALGDPDPDTGEFPTVAGASVYLPRDWPVQQTQVPILKIGLPTDDKESLGKSGIKFNTTTSIEVIGEVSAAAEDSDAGAGKVLTALLLFQREIELAVIGDPLLFGGDSAGLIEQLQSVHTKYAQTAEGALHRGAVSVTFNFTFYQGEEAFQQPKLTPVERWHLYADLINVADATGVYAPPMPYVPTPAPRTDGPDGRIEGEIDYVPPA